MAHFKGKLSHHSATTICTQMYENTNIFKKAQHNSKLGSKITMRFFEKDLQRSSEIEWPLPMVLKITFQRNFFSLSSFSSSPCLNPLNQFHFFLFIKCTNPGLFFDYFIIFKQEILQKKLLAPISGTGIRLLSTIGVRSEHRHLNK